MRVLIVGCGYVGLPLGKELVRLGHEVFGLRRSSLAEAEMKAAGITPVIGDVSDPDSLRKLSLPFDWVVNSVSSGLGGVTEYRQVYLNGTRNLVDWLASTPLKKFVYTSSIGVYGQDDGSLVTEASATEPSAETARVLVETEQTLLEATRANNFPAAVLRVAGIYGPERGYFLRQFLQGEARITGDGKRWMNMIHRDDLCCAIVAALMNGQSGGIYNAVDDEPVAQVDFFRWLSEKLDKPMPPSVPDVGSERSKRGVTNKRVANRKLKSELGFSLRYPTFREGYTDEIKRLLKAAGGTD